MALFTAPAAVSSHPYRLTHIPLPPGDAGVKLTAREMDRAARGQEGAQNPAIIQFAKAATSNVPDKDQTAEMFALRDYIRSIVRFVNETGERIQTPVVTIGWDGSRFDPYLAAGDCDCQTTLLMACCIALGIECKLLVTSTSPDGQYSHVLLMAYDKRRYTWTPLDCTRQTTDMQHVTRAALYEYGQLNEIANSRIAKPPAGAVTGMINQQGAIMRNTQYQLPDGRITLGDTSTDLTNLLLPLSEGAGLRLAGANTTAVLAGGANIGPMGNSSTLPLGSLSGSGFFGAPTASVPGWIWLLAIAAGAWVVTRK